MVFPHCEYELVISLSLPITISQVAVFPMNVAKPFPTRPAGVYVEEIALWEIAIAPWYNICVCLSIKFPLLLQQDSVVFVLWRTPAPHSRLMLYQATEYMCAGISGEEKHQWITECDSLPALTDRKEYSIEIIWPNACLNSPFGPKHLCLEVLNYKILLYPQITKKHYTPSTYQIKKNVRRRVWR